MHIIDVGEIDGRKIAVDVSDSTPVLRIEVGDKSRHSMANPLDARPLSLARLVADADTVSMEAVEGRFYALIPYTAEVDHALVELIDLLVGIRYSIPGIVQLELALSEDESDEFEEALGAS